VDMCSGGGVGGERDRGGREGKRGERKTDEV